MNIYGKACIISLIFYVKRLLTRREKEYNMQYDSDGLSTSILLRKLFEASDIETFVDKNDQALGLPPFYMLITEICAKAGETHERIIKKSGIERSYGHQLFSGRRKPSRDKVIQLAFGFGFNAEETQELLKIAQKSPLYPRIIRDAAILKCLSEGKTIFEVQQMLEALGLTILGGDRQYG